MIFESKFHEFNFGKLIWKQMTIDLDFHLVTLPLYTENDPNVQLWSLCKNKFFKKKLCLTFIWWNFRNLFENQEIENFHRIYIIGFTGFYFFKDIFWHFFLLAEKKIAEIEGKNCLQGAHFVRMCHLWFSFHHSSKDWALCVVIDQALTWSSDVI